MYVYGLLSVYMRRCQSVFCCFVLNLYSLTDQPCFLPASTFFATLWSAGCLLLERKTVAAKRKDSACVDRRITKGPTLGGGRAQNLKVWSNTSCNRLRPPQKGKPQSKQT